MKRIATLVVLTLAASASAADPTSDQRFETVPDERHVIVPHCSTDINDRVIRRGQMVNVFLVKSEDATGIVVKDEWKRLTVVEVDVLRDKVTLKARDKKEADAILRDGEVQRVDLIRQGWPARMALEIVQ